MDPARADLRALFDDIDRPLPCLDGNLRPYINLDNAASTPPLRSVTQTVNRFLGFYSSVHRGSGYKSQLATHAYEQARAMTLEFVGADPTQMVCIFGKNTTEAVNKLARRFPFTEQRDVVLVSTMEHHSNDLPWRAAARVVHVGVHADGSLDEADLDAKLAQYAGRVALVAITGASNVTGLINPVRRIAHKAHAAGAQIAVDCAQLAPHRPVAMGTLEDPGHFDYLFLSGHKLYAPFGTGALVGRRDTFAQGDPDLRGGGEVEIVTLDSVHWSEPPERDEAGSPNTVGAVALGAALRALQAIGMEAVAAHEADLTAHALRRLPGVPGLRIFGDRDPERAGQRLGVIPFAIEGVPHGLVAAVLGHEFSIGVRSGCFCAHPYLLSLLQVAPEAAAQVRASILAGDRIGVPGLVRMSFGLYNTLEEVDAAVEALHKIARGEYRGRYIPHPASGEWRPQGWDPCFATYFP